MVDTEHRKTDESCALADKRLQQLNAAAHRAWLGWVRDDPHFGGLMANLRAHTVPAPKLVEVEMPSAEASQDDDEGHAIAKLRDEVTNLQHQLDSLESGRRVLLPRTKAHADAMAVVPSAFKER